MSDDLLETLRETLSIKEGEISLRTPFSKIIRDSIDMVELIVPPIEVAVSPFTRLVAVAVVVLNTWLKSIW